VELFEGNQRIDDAHSLIVGPDDSAIRSELAWAIAELTLRIARDAHTTEARL
jgi:hypothetical protein